MKHFLTLLAVLSVGIAAAPAGELSHFRIDRSLLAEKNLTITKNLIELPDFGDIPDAVRVKRGALVHTRQLNGLDTGKGDFGFGDLIGQLEGICRAFDADLADVAKLNFYVADDSLDLRSAILGGMAVRWAKGKLPAVTIIKTPILNGKTKIAADAVFVAASDSDKVERFERDAATMPANRDILYVSGRAASGEIAEATSGTMKELFAVLEHLGSTPADVVQVKAFIRPMTEWETVEREIEKSFGDLGAPPLVFVEWTSTSRATEIELIAAAPEQFETNETVSYFTPPGDKSSPVFSRVARIHADEVIYIGGVTTRDNSSPEKEVGNVFHQLERIAEKSGTNLRHFAKATYYVSDNEVSSALNQLRPNYFDPERPPAASKVIVPRIGEYHLGLLIDMVAAPAE